MFLIQEKLFSFVFFWFDVFFFNLISFGTSSFKNVDFSFQIFQSTTKFTYWSSLIKSDEFSQRSACHKWIVLGIERALRSNVFFFEFRKVKFFFKKKEVIIFYFLALTIHQLSVGNICEL